MAPPKSGRPHLKVKAGRDGAMTQDAHCLSDDADEDNTGRGNVSHAISTIVQYFEDNAPVFRELRELRQKGWDSPEADEFFKEKRRQADDNSKETFRRLRKMRGIVANEMQRLTGAFTIEPHQEQQRILDLCMAPGDYLAKAIWLNPTAQAVALTLPTSEGGLRAFLKETDNLKIDFLDITTLAVDMGIEPDVIPHLYPEVLSFFQEKYFDDGEKFDLVLCDGTIRNAPERTRYRSFERESRRLLLTQLALGLEHVRPGGTMIILLHKFERLRTIHLLYTFVSFAKVVVFKHPKIHAKRSSFYMIASDIQSEGWEALKAVQEWKREWKVSTLGTDEEWRDDYARAADFGDLGVEGVLKDFGPGLVEAGQVIWQIQADALKRAPFMRSDPQSVSFLADMEGFAP